MSTKTEICKVDVKATNIMIACDSQIDIPGLIRNLVPWSKCIMQDVVF